MNTKHAAIAQVYLKDAFIFVCLCVYIHSSECMNVTPLNVSQSEAHEKLFKAIDRSWTWKIAEIASKNPGIVSMRCLCPLSGDMIFPILYIPCIELRDRGRALHGLLKAGADPNVTDDQGNTFLHFPRRHIQENSLACLLKYGVDIDKKNRKGRTPLMEYIRAGENYMMLDMVEFSMNINAQDNHGKTALHYACKKGWDQIIDRLWDYGASFYILDNKGRTPLDLLYNKNKELADIFEKFFDQFRSIKILKISKPFKNRGRCVRELLEVCAAEKNMEPLRELHERLKKIPTNEFLSKVKCFDSDIACIFCAIKNWRGIDFILAKEQRRKQRERKLAIKQFIKERESGWNMSEVD